MAREAEPTLTPDEDMDAEGRGRLASFISLVQEKPGVMGAILGAYGSPEHLIEAAAQVDYTTPEDPAERQYGMEALLGAGALFSEELDLRTTPDRITSERIRGRLARAAREGSIDGGRRRILRVVEFTVEVGAWQEHQAPTAAAQ